VDTFKFDSENVRLIARREFDKVEKRLLRNYESAKKSGRRERLLHAISALAHFYARPFKEDLNKADLYFRERYRLFPDSDSALELVMFSQFVLSDPQRTLKETANLRSLIRDEGVGDLRSLYDAIAIEGQAHLALGQEEAACQNLAELLDLAQRNPGGVPFGDELNFIKQMVGKNLSPLLCKSLLQISRNGVRSTEYRDEMSRLLERL
jgi:hypothetical protein